MNYGYAVCFIDARALEWQTDAAIHCNTAARATLVCVMVGVWLQVGLLSRLRVWRRFMLFGLCFFTFTIFDTSENNMSKPQSCQWIIIIIG